MLKLFPCWAIECGQGAMCGFLQRKFVFIVVVQASEIERHPRRVSHSHHGRSFVVEYLVLERVDALSKHRHAALTMYTRAVLALFCYLTPPHDCADDMPDSMKSE